MMKLPAKKMVAKKKQAAKTAPAKKQAAKKAPMSPQALAAEMLRVLTSKLGPNELIMPSDVNALLASLTGPSAHDRLSDAEADAKVRAQDLAFEAMEATSEAQARKLSKRALRLDPDCVDAIVTLTDLDANATQDAIAGFKRAVEAGERSLGAAFIAEHKGQFWLLLETRPLMRALEVLAETSKSVGLYLDAIAVYERMLELNPNDNQSARYPLLALYLTVGDLKGAGSLLRRYKDDAMAVFAWGRVLERLLAGDKVAAGAALRKARTANPFVEQYMTGQMPLPDEEPEGYSPGSEEEAALCLIELSRAWDKHREAVLWLFDQLEVERVRKAPTKLTLLKTPVKGKSIH